MPTIASTAGRRILPSADLRVEGATPAAFGAAVGAGLQQLGDAGADAGKAVQQFELVKQEEANRLAEFDRQTQFVAFGSDQATKLEEARRNLSGPAQDFTKSFMGGFDADAAAFLEKVPARDRHAWQARMAQLRAGVAGDALRSEFTQRDSYYKTTIGDTLGKLASGAMSNPDQMDGFRAQGEQIIAASGLSAQDKLEYTTRWKGAVSVAAAQGDVMRDPEGALRRLGGLPSAATEGVVSPTSSDVAEKIINVESGGDPNARSKTSSASGLGQFTNATWLAIYKDKIGTDGLTDAQILAKKNDPALSRRLTKALVDENKAVLGASDLPATDANVYALHFLGPQYGVQLIRAPADAPVESFLPRGFISANRSVLAGKTAGEIRQWAAIKMGGSAAAPGAGQSSATPNTEPALDPRYADLPSEVRAQLIGAAQREIDAKQAADAQANRSAHSAWLNNFMNELNDGTAGEADIEAARKSGILTDFNEISRAQSIVQQRNRQNTELATFNAMWEAQQTFNPFDTGAQKAADAGYKQALLGGVAPLEAAAAIWERTSILPESAAVSIRGAMISTNPETVGGASAFASNMLARNPNAFAGVKGGEEIERNALLYGHLVNDLGATPAEAAAQVARRNAPEVKRTIDASKPATEAFRKKLLAVNVESKLGAEFGSFFDLSLDPDFASPQQRAVAAQDYADIAANHFATSGDAGAAESYALAQMKKLYGVVNGRLMKYPPTRAYPPINGSQQYIFEQAAADIKAVTKREIDPGRVYLMPVPTATAEAFRAGKPVPYAVHYLDEVNGQKVYRVLAGKVFRADPSAEIARVAKERETAFGETRQRRREAEDFARGARIARFGYLPGDE